LAASQDAAGSLQEHFNSQGTAPVSLPEPFFCTETAKVTGMLFFPMFPRSARIQEGHVALISPYFLVFVHGCLNILKKR